MTTFAATLKRINVFSLTCRLLAFLALQIGGLPAHADEPEKNARPFTSTLADVKELRPNSAQLATAADRAKTRLLQDISKLGPNGAARATRLSALSTTGIIERLAIQPAVGPSTIAAPSQGMSIPFPSVNWGGDKGGATTGHPGVVLLLAKREGTDNYTIYCSGTLINQSVVLTAAHCICHSDNQGADYPTGNLCLHGSESIAPSPLLDPNRWKIFFQHAGLRNVKAIALNENYAFSDDAVRNDLAAFILAQPENEINPASLPTSEGTVPWSQGSIVGYGYSANPEAANATFLEQLVLPGIKAQGQVNSASCNSEVFLEPGAGLCSIYDLTGAASQSTVCGGDSGGPLWTSGGADPEIGVTSGRNNQNCAANGTVAFQMAITFQAHRTWIAQQLSTFGTIPVKGRWPTFGENLRYVLDRRNIQVFDSAGKYRSEAWMTSDGTEIVLGTINSSGPITQFGLEDRAGTMLCTGVAGKPHSEPNVDYCSAAIAPGVQFRVVAQGEANEYLQYVVSTHSKGTSLSP